MMATKAIRFQAMWLLLVASLSLIGCASLLENSADSKEPLAKSANVTLAESANITLAEIDYAISVDFDSPSSLEPISSEVHLKSNVIHNLNYSCLGASCTITFDIQEANSHKAVPAATTNQSRSIEEAAQPLEIIVVEQPKCGGGVIVDLNPAAANDNLRSLPGVGITGYSPVHPEPNTWYFLLSRDSGRAVDNQCGNGLRVIQTSYHGSDCQKYRFEEVSEGFYKIISASGLVLEAKDGSRDNGTPIQLEAYQDRDYQMWSLESKSEGYLRIRVRHTGQCVDLYEGYSYSGNNINTFRCHDASSDMNQQWFLAKIC